MTVTIEWANDEKSLLRMDIDGRWTWEDFDNGVDAAFAMMRRAPGRVDVVTDIRSAGPQECGTPWASIRFLVRFMPQNVGTIVVAGQGGPMLQLFRVLLEFYKPQELNIKYVHTLEAAFEVLKLSRYELETVLMPAV